MAMLVERVVECLDRPNQVAARRSGGSPAPIVSWGAQLSRILPEMSLPFSSVGVPDAGTSPL